MKKTVALLLALSLLVCCAAAQLASAETDVPTVLPLGTAFGMNLESVQALCPSCTVEMFDDDAECGSVYAEGVSLGIGNLIADNLYFEISRENSALLPRMRSVTAYLPIGDNSIADFRAALAEFTSVYGTPDSDPFDEDGVASYVEYGGLYAGWTKADCRISLSLYRSSYGDSLYVYFATTQNYDAADLAE